MIDRRREGWKGERDRLSYLIMKLGRRDREEARDLADKWPLSLVIPAYNAAERLPGFVEALRKNDLRNVEILLVDDGSTDGTGAVARSLKVPCVAAPARSGPAGARNLGLQVSTHPVLLFVDSDLLLPPDAILHIRETLDLYAHRPDVAGVLGQYSESLPWDEFFTQFKNLTTCYLYRLTETQSPFLHTAVFCVRRSVLEEAGGFDAHMSRGEDFRLGTLLGSRGYHFIIDRRIKATHLKRYSLKGILVEDWLRIRELARVRLTTEEKRFSYRAHRWNRLLSVVLPAIILMTGLLGFWNRVFWPVAGVLLGGFLLFNAPLLVYLVRLRGFFFGLKAAGFLFLEMLWAEIALGASILFRRRGPPRMESVSEVPNSSRSGPGAPD